jgi:hypothetical protein
METSHQAATKFLANKAIEGFALATSGVLFFTKALFDLKIGKPPANGIDLLAWKSAQRFPLAMVNEVSFIATVFLALGLVGLFASLDRADHHLAQWGCGILAVNLPVMMVLTIIQGRLVYSVYSIATVQDSTTLQFLVSLYYGGQHAVLLMLGIATILVALAMRATPYGNALVWTGVITGIVDLVGSYPWLLGVPLNFACEIVFASWFIAIGIKLTRVRLASTREG